MTCTWPVTYHSSMSSRTRPIAAGITAVAFSVALVGCGGTTVEGSAPEISTESSESSSATSSETFAQERPEKPGTPVSPPPAREPAPEPVRDPAEPPPEEEPAPEPPPPADVPGAGDFAGLLEQQNVALPEGVDPVATATEACGRFDGGEQMVDVSGWLGEHAQLDPEQQGFFLGAAVGTFCPENFPKLG